MIFRYTRSLKMRLQGMLCLKLLLLFIRVVCSDEGLWRRGVALHGAPP